MAPQIIQICNIIYLSVNNIYIYIQLNALFRVSLLENLERIQVHKIIRVQNWGNSCTVVIYITIRATIEIHFKSKFKKGGLSPAQRYEKIVIG